MHLPEGILAFFKARAKRQYRLRYTTVSLPRRALATGHFDRNKWIAIYHPAHLDGLSKQPLHLLRLLTVITIVGTVFL